MRRWKLALLGSLVAVASVNAMACYTVTDRDGRVIYNGVDAPVDMRYQLHETMSWRFPPGSHMVFGADPSCRSVNVVSARTVRPDSVVFVNTRTLGGPRASKTDRN